MKNRVQEFRITFNIDKQLIGLRVWIVTVNFL